MTNIIEDYVKLQTQYTDITRMDPPKDDSESPFETCSIANRRHKYSLKEKSQQQYSDMKTNQTKTTHA